MAPQREWFEKDYYEVLGVPSTATEKDLTRAYRKLAKQYHPDANPGDAAAEERFKEVSAANDVLSDPEKRKEYDQVREMVAQGVGPGGPGGFGGGFPGGFGPGGQTFNFEDLGGFGDILGNLFGQGGAAGGGRGRRGRRPPVGPTPGADLEAELHLDFLDAVHGITTSVHFTAEAVCHVCHGIGAKPGTTPDVCPTCGGTGDVLVDQGPFSFSQVCPQCGGRGQIVKDKCRNCKGRGVEVRPREVKVKVPAGVQGGSADQGRGSRRARSERRAARRPLRDRARVAPSRLRAVGQDQPHGEGADHVRRGRVGRAGEGADARVAGHPQGEARHAERHDAEGEGPRHRAREGRRPATCS